jgi:large subunit ribosomal protein L25
MDIPVVLLGAPVGVIKGGKLTPKLKKVTLKAFPADMPDFIEVDVTHLEVGKSVKVSDIPEGKYTVLNVKAIPLATVVSTRELKQADSTDAPATATAATPAPAAKK